MVSFSSRRRSALIAAAGLASGLAAGSRAAFAQSAAYPTHPVRLIVPFAPGGSTDALARLLATRLGERLGQSFIVENRPGAGGNIGMGQAARANPDGYTLVLVSGSFVVNPGLYAKVPYDPVKDFAPISYVAGAPSLLVSHPSVGAGSLAELIQLIKASPGKFNYASPGSGSAQHLAGELFRLAIGSDVVHVPFNGAGPAVTAVLAGHVQLGFASLPAVLPHVANGGLKAYAVTSNVRSPAAPQIPTFIEAGVSGVESDHLQGLLAPAGTPAAIVSRLSEEVAAIVKEPAISSRLIELGFVLVANTPAQFADVIRAQLEKWPKVVKAANLRVE